MNTNIFSSKRNSIIAAVLALIAVILSVFGENSLTGLLVMILCFGENGSAGRFFKRITTILLGLYAFTCLIDFLPAVSAASSTLNLFVSSDFVGSCLVSAGSVLLLVGSLYDFEYITLFKLGALATGLGMLVSFAVTTLVVARSGAFSGIGFIEILSVLAVPFEAIFFISVFFLAKSKKSVNCLETDEADSI